jgi:hypothetical protein
MSNIMAVARAASRYMLLWARMAYSLERDLCEGPVGSGVPQDSFDKDEFEVSG